MLCEPEYNFSDRDQGVNHVRIMRYNFSCVALSGYYGHVAGKMIRNRRHKVSGLQKVACPPANDQSNLDPIFSSAQRLAHIRIGRSKPSRPSVQFPNMGQTPAGTLRADRVGTLPDHTRTRFAGAEKLLSAASNVTLCVSRQILQLLLLDTLDPSNCLLAIEVCAKRCKHPIANIGEVTSP